MAPPAAPLLVLAAVLLTGGALAAAPAAKNVMALGEAHPAWRLPLSYVKSNDPELAAYLADPDSVCTFFIPNEDAMRTAMKSLGKFVGVASQNQTLQRLTFNYHVVPGKAMTADEVGRLNRTMTRANETLYIWRHDNTTFIYSRPGYPVALKSGARGAANTTNVRAGGCIVHDIDETLVPPSAIPTVQGWLDAVGTAAPELPKDKWAPIQAPLPPPPGSGAAPAAAAAGTGAGAGAKSAAGTASAGLGAAAAAACTAAALLALL